MRKNFFLSFVAVCFSLAGAQGLAQSAPCIPNLNGNGGPSGSHYNLNIIGAPSGFPSIDNSGGNVIHVPLIGNVKINLSQGPFYVLDDNAMDGAAAFQLPSPDPTNSGTTTYSVYARALGKPGGSSTMQTCATDPTTLATYCSIYQSVQVRNSGKSSFSNVSKELLYVYYYDSTGTLVRAPLFDSSLQDYYWSYTNNKLKLLQLRFYQCSTTVP